MRHRVGLVDLAPTLLDFLGTPYRDEQFQGRSFAALLAGGAAPSRPRVLLVEKEHEIMQHTGRVKAIYSGPWKYITRTPAPMERLVQTWLTEHEDDIEAFPLPARRAPPAG